MNFQNDTVAGVPPVIAVHDARPSGGAIRTAAIETLHDAAGDPQLSERLSVVGASVAIELRDVPGQTFVLRMDAGSLAILEDDDPRADVRIKMDAADLHEIFAGGLHLPMKIAQGAVTFTGPVRRFLRVTAILRQLADTYAEHLAAAREDERTVR